MPRPKRRAVTDVKPSTIPNAGMGLFAKRRIRKGFRLGEYKGEKISYEEAHRRDPSYFIYLDAEPVPHSGFVLDGRTMANPMRWPNHAVDPKYELPNAEFRLERNGRIYAYTLRPITPGEEVFVDYGYNPAPQQ